MTWVIWPGRALMTTTRDERKTASGIEWVTNMIVDPGLLPDALDLLVHPFPRHLVERAERLVHEQDRRLERRAPARSRPVAASRPTAATGGGRLKSASSTRSSISFDPRGPLGPRRSP